MAVNSTQPGEPNQARSYFEQLVQRSVEVSIGQIAREEPYAPLGNETRERALNVFGYARKVPAAWRRSYDLLMALAPKMEMAGQRDAWIERLTQGVACSEQQRDKQAEAELSLQIGYLQLLLSRWPKATEWLERSRACFVCVGETAGEGRALNRLALVALREGRLSQAEALASEAQRRLDTEDLDLAHGNYVLGTVARDRRDWSTAERHYRASLAIREAQGDRRRTAWGLTSLGSVLRSQEQFRDAASCYERALEIFADISDPLNEAVALMNLGNVYLQTNQFARALTLYHQAESMFQALSDVYNLGKVKSNQGLAYTNLGQYERAESVFLESIEIWKALDVITSLCNAQNGLGDVYRKQQQFQEAERVIYAGLENVERMKDPEVYAQHKKMLKANLKKAQVGDTD